MRRTWLVVSWACLPGCDDAASVAFETGELELRLSSADVEVPPSLRTGEGRLSELPCGPMGMCASAGSLVLECDAGRCDPAPLVFASPVGGVVDVGELAGDLEGLFAELDGIEVTAVRYAVVANTLTVDVPDVELLWGGEGAVDVGPDTPRLGVVPAVAARTTPSGEAPLDEAGVQGLSMHLVGVSRRVRFFARTAVDLEPGGPLPGGELQATVTVSLRAYGRLLD
ncbi:MAG: hypothetical protein NZ898_11875 [Myxococcota bacterium]|nr:hypothetical protein [Myxococcota bacterium]